MSGQITWSVFTKPWKMPIPELGAYVRSLGFEGIELPVRPGYPVEPENVAELPRAARQLAEHGVSIESVAGPTDEATIVACAEAGVPIHVVNSDLWPTAVEGNRKVADFRHTILSGRGHFLMQEAPEKLTQAMIERVLEMTHEGE